MELKYEAERIFAEDENGKVIAEVTFPITDGVADIEHTFVDDCLRGQGAAGKLMAAAAEEIRKRGLKVKLTCTYAAGWFEKHSEHSDLM